mmetsp:Transcript_14017/g.23945  ORF Transcript_14017/g.23945 Transcript_14017/m.23945 type:complete len:363 (+) Transcript_14017:179-1267(+)
MDNGNIQSAHENGSKDVHREVKDREERIEKNDEKSVENKELVGIDVRNGDEQMDILPFLMKSQRGSSSSSPNSEHSAKRKWTESNGYDRDEGFHTSSGSGTQRQRLLKREDEEEEEEEEEVVKVNDQLVEHDVHGGNHDMVSNDSPNHYDVYTHDTILVNNTTTTIDTANGETSDSSFKIPPAVEASSSSAPPCLLLPPNDLKTTPTKQLLAIEAEVELSDDGPLVGSSILEDSDADLSHAHQLEEMFLGITHLERELHRAKRDLRKLQTLIQKDADLSMRIPQLRGRLAVAATEGSSLDNPQPLAMSMGSAAIDSSQLAASLANDTRAIMRRDLRDHVIRMFKSQSSSRSNSSQSNHSASS